MQVRNDNRFDLSDVLASVFLGTRVHDHAWPPPPWFLSVRRSAAWLITNEQGRCHTKTKRWAICAHGRGNHAIDQDQWHLIRYANGDRVRYDLHVDPNEWNNLLDPKQDSARFEDVMKRLEAELPALNEEVGSLRHPMRYHNSLAVRGSAIDRMQTAFSAEMDE